MANTKISNLTSAGTLTGSEVAPIVQSGSTVKATAQNIANLAIPSQTGQSGKYLTTDGTNTSWAAAGGYPTITYEITFIPFAFGANVMINTTGATFTLQTITGGYEFEITASTSIFTLNKTFGFSNNPYFTSPTRAAYSSFSRISSTQAKFIFDTGGGGPIDINNSTSYSGFPWQFSIIIYP